jgi:two-component system chemotaxis sensor kinase CheA
VSRESLALRLRAAFLEDLDEQLRALTGGLLALETEPGAATPLGAVFRAAHTLMGAARAAGLGGVERLCHALEEVLSRARADVRLEPAHFARLFAAADALARAGEALRAGAEPDAAALAEAAHAVERGDAAFPAVAPMGGERPAEPPATLSHAGISTRSTNSVPGADGVESPPLSGAASPESGPVEPSSPDMPSVDAQPSVAGRPGARVDEEQTAGAPSSPVPPAVPAEAASGMEPRSGEEVTSPRPGEEIPGAQRPTVPAAPRTPGGEAPVRVAAEKLDALLSASGQLLLARGRVAAQAAEAEALRDHAGRAEARWRRAGRELRVALERAGAGRAALEALAALEDDLHALSRGAGGLAAGLRAGSRSLSLAVDDVAGQVHRARLRPFAEACESLPRSARDLAAASGKEVRLRIEGGQVEADRAVLDGVREALIHLVRNAVDHGIEPPAARAATGKPPAGTITVAAALRGDRLVVTVADDGRGVDEVAVGARLAREGRPGATDRDGVAAALFEGGFSTRDRAGEVSGRGVGLDAARAAAARVRATLEVRWRAGEGTVFTLESPLTLATIRALLVSAGGHPFAVPTAAVERVERVEPASLRRAGGREVVPAAAGPVAVAPLARVLGPPLAEAPVTGPFTVVHLCAGPRRLAAAVDEVLGEQELLVRPLERGGRPLPHLSGAAILPTGVVALVLDPARVVETGLGAAAEGMRMEEAGAAVPSARRILVVDDSITTRTLERSTLEAAGYEVMTAVDGADGWRLLQERGADLVVSDVEMPRMDGFALCAAIRASRRFASTPVVLVTSLEKPEHRERGMEAGADAYVGKSEFDQEALLGTIRQLLG